MFTSSKWCICDCLPGFGLVRIGSAAGEQAGRQEQSGREDQNRRSAEVRTGHLLGFRSEGLMLVFSSAPQRQLDLCLKLQRASLVASMSPFSSRSVAKQRSTGPRVEPQSLNLADYSESDHPSGANCDQEQIAEGSSPSARCSRAVLRRKGRRVKREIDSDFYCTRAYSASSVGIKCVPLFR